MTEQTYRIAFSTKYRRPGCVLIQAIAGGTVPSMLFNRLFPAETWLVDKIDDVCTYSATESQLHELSIIAKKAVSSANEPKGT